MRTVAPAPGVAIAVVSSVLIAATGVVTPVAAVATPVTAGTSTTAPHWQTQKTRNGAAPDGSLAGVSCVATACVAVGHQLDSAGFDSPP